MENVPLLQRCFNQWSVFLEPLRSADWGIPVLAAQENCSCWWDRERTWYSVWRKCVQPIGMCVEVSQPQSRVLLGVVVTGKITTEWIILKTIIRFVVLRGVFQPSLQDYTRLKIAPSQLMFFFFQLWVGYLRRPNIAVLKFSLFCTICKVPQMFSRFGRRASLWNMYSHCIRGGKWSPGSPLHYSLHFL
jgi:hypothetical protein